MSQSEKSVFITGVSSGIGKATAEYFAAQGWKVFGTVRKLEQYSAWAQSHKIHLLYVDVTNLESIQKALQEAHSIAPLKVVINNAGFGADGIFEAMNDAFIEEQFNTNVFGLMRVTREAIPYLRETKGLIIQLSSVAGRVSFPLFSIYNATKWAVEGLSESLKYELQTQGISIKLIEPGAIKTEFSENSRKMAGYEHPLYQQMSSNGLEVMKKANERGGEAIEVAKKIFQAAIDGSSKFRYPVGGGAPMLLFLRKILPPTLWFGLMRSIYKL